MWPIANTSRAQLWLVDAIMCKSAFSFKEKESDRKETLQNVCVFKMWQAPFEAGVGNVRVRCYECKMLSLKAAGAKWKNNMASVVW